MKRTLTLAVLVAAFTIAVGVLVAQPGKGQARGIPNHGVSAPGQPNHYASPSPHRHP